MIENKQSLDIAAALEEIKRAAAHYDAKEKFWYAGEVPEATRGASINSKVNQRLNRIELYMKRHSLPVYRPWLKQLILWHKVKGGPIKSGVIALKYLLLDDCMRRQLAWTKVLDDHAEALALKAYQEHKELRNS